MLKQRVLTACFLLLLVLAAVYVLDPLQFSLFIGLVILTGAWEWSRLAGLRAPAARAAYVLAFALLLAVSRALPAEALDLVLALSLLWWLAAFLMVLSYPRGTGLWAHSPLLALAGVFVLLPGWLTFNFLREQAQFPLLILLLLAAVAAADIGAYFAGRRFGRRKLAPRVSPNKTWEGFWGGVASCCILILGVALGYRLAGLAVPGLVWLKLFGFALLLGMVSVVGDLLESMLKRFRDLKDSGRILPGHGGMLDRIDGISAAAPVYALLVMSIGADLA